MQKEFSDMVKSLVKNPSDIDWSLTPEKINLWHMATGISGEAGEVLDEVKKHVINGKPLNRDKLILELGDVEFYMEGLRQEIGVTRDFVLQKNIEKLTSRYNGEYSDEKAQAKSDQL